MGPEYYYVRDQSSPVAHHWDYSKDRATHALCGHQYQGEIRYEGSDRPQSVCRKCQDALPTYEAGSWRRLAESLDRNCHHLQTEVVASQDESKRLKQRLDEQERLAAAVLGRSSPPQYFVRDTKSKAAHHWSYTDDAEDTALCGHEYAGQIIYEGPERPKSVCDQCEVILPKYHARWWREAARSAEISRRKFQQRADLAANELKKLQSEYDDLLNRYNALSKQTERKSAGDDQGHVTFNGVHDPLLDLLDND